MSLAPQITRWLSSHGNVPLKRAVAAHFGQFVKGERVDDRDFMKRVECRLVGRHPFDHEVWSVRPFFQPQHRFFSTFAMPDWLIVLCMQARRNLKTDTQWHSQTDKCCRSWDRLLPGNRRWSGSRLEHYITYNAEHRDGRWDER